MTTGVDPQLFEYAIDAHDRVTYVSPSWLEFARANAAPHLTPEYVLGRSLFDFITEDATREIYAMMLARARSTRAPITVHFRCDAPDLRRFMQLEIGARADGSVALAGQLLRSEAREVVAVMEIHRPHDESLLTVCSWCKRAQVDDQWLEIEGAVERLDLFDADSMPQLTHGICPECEVRAYREINEGAA